MLAAAVKLNGFLPLMHPIRKCSGSKENVENSYILRYYPILTARSLTTLPATPDYENCSFAPRRSTSGWASGMRILTCGKIPQSVLNNANSVQTTII